MLSDPTTYLLLIAIFNQRSDQLLLDVFQCCCDLHNFLLWKLVKLRSLVGGYISQYSYYCSIQDGIVVIAHGGDTWLEQSGGESMGVFNEYYL